MAKCNVCGKEEGLALLTVSPNYNGRGFEIYLCKHHYNESVLNINKNGIKEKQFVDNVLSRCTFVPQNYFNTGWIQYTPEEEQYMWATNGHILEFVGLDRLLELMVCLNQDKESKEIFKRRFPQEYIAYYKNKDIKDAISNKVGLYSFYALEKETGDKIYSKEYESLSCFFIMYDKPQYIIALV